MSFEERPQPAAVEGPDLQTQFEEILDQVWRCEANWRFDDRLDIALAYRRPVTSGTASRPDRSRS